VLFKLDLSLVIELREVVDDGLERGVLVGQSLIADVNMKQ
jgi:hypothetical protein